MSDKPNQPMARRGFFRKFVVDTLNTAEEVGKQAVQRLNDQVDAITSIGDNEIVHMDSGYDSELRYLRPPGFGDEYTFTSACQQCGLCVESCPADAIKMAQETAGGFPYIIAREQPCVVCEDLSCMKACPSGALKLVDRAKLGMGLAVVDHHTCLRSHWNDTGAVQACDDCRDVCPYGEKALALDENDMLIVKDGCTGCGLCEKACPTEPTSIWSELAVNQFDPFDDYGASHRYKKHLGRGKLIRMGRTDGVLNNRRRIASQTRWRNNARRGLYRVKRPL